MCLERRAHIQEYIHAVVWWRIAGQNAGTLNDGSERRTTGKSSSSRRTMEWVEVLRVGPTQHGRGLFALQEFKPKQAICAYFGTLVPAHLAPEQHSNMVIVSALKEYVIVGTPGNAISGAVFTNDPRGSGRQANARIVVSSTKLSSVPEQMKAFERQQKAQKVQAVGVVMPVFEAVKLIRVGQEILLPYRWSNDTWRDVERSRHSKKRRDNK